MAEEEKETTEEHKEEHKETRTEGREQDSPWLVASRYRDTNGGTMAEEEKETTEEHKEEHKETRTEGREQGSPGRTEERRVDRREEQPAATGPSMAECPECYIDIRADKLGSHRYRAHGVDRRTAAKNDDKRKDKPSAKRQPVESDTKEEREKEPASRWAKVRSSW